MLVVEPVSPNTDESVHGDLNLLARGWDAWQQPIDRLIVGEAEREFFGDPIDAHTARYHRLERIGRI